MSLRACDGREHRVEVLWDGREDQAGVDRGVQEQGEQQAPEAHCVLRHCRL